MLADSAAGWARRQATLYVVGYVRALHLEADVGRNRRVYRLTLTAGPELPNVRLRG
jgi:hypothetical protein